MSLILPRFCRAQEAIHDQAAIDRAVAESVQPNQNPGATAPGDTRKLRGIPAIGRGVSGAVPGTSPHADRFAEAGS